MDNQPIGVFDSGVGGLSVLRELRAQLPGERYIYMADQAHVPYGPRGLEEVRRFSLAGASFLRGRGVKLIVVACNTASAAALMPIRAAQAGFPIVGMEPAVKPAAEQSRSGVIGVIATEATFQGELFASVVDRYARGVRVLPQTCPGLVERIEAGETGGPALEAFLRTRLQPLLDAGIDELVLGCTHYAFAASALQKVFGPEVKIIDPAPAVARQVERLLAGRLADGNAAGVDYFTSGDGPAFARILRQLLGEEAAVRPLRWADGVFVES
jgi:glutamate racemase